MCLSFLSCHSFHFVLAPQAKYFIPTEAPRQRYVEHILDLPLNEPPELFGLHPNAEITCAARPPR